LILIGDVLIIAAHVLLIGLGTLPGLPRVLRLLRPTGQTPVGSITSALPRLVRPTGKTPVGRPTGKTPVGSSSSITKTTSRGAMPGAGKTTTPIGTSRAVVRITASSGRTSVNTFPALCLGCLGRLAAASADSPLPSTMSSTHSDTTITTNATYLSFRTSGFLSKVQDVGIAKAEVAGSYQVQKLQSEVCSSD
jgi:hypothetical protein